MIRHRRTSLFTFAALMLFAAFAPPSQATDRYNVLFFAVDDLRPELGCYGTSYIKSPNIDALAARGLVFDLAYCQQAVCSPSRTSLMTGLRPDTTKVWDLNTHFRDTIGNDVITLPQQFKNHGYHAMGIGKIYHGGYDDAASWSEPWERPGGSSYVLEENVTMMQRKHAAAKAKGLKGKPLSRASRGPAYEGADVPDNEYTDGACAEKAVAALRRLKDEPFFLAVGMAKPHLPFNCPKRFWDMYDPAEIVLPDNPHEPHNATQYTLTNWGELRNYEGIPEDGPVSDETARTLIHGYRACVSAMDAAVGKVLDELDRLGLRDNTIIVLWGDHGWKLGEHGAWCKHSNMELDARVPLIIAAPGMKAAGRHSKALVEFVDIYPTLCELAGLPRPKQLEGVSFAPLLDEPDRPWKSAAFSQYPRGSVMGYSIRTDRYRYTQWQDKQSGEVVGRELYDQLRDPKNNFNVAGEPENATLVAELASQLKAGWKAAAPK